MANLNQVHNDNQALLDNPVAVACLDMPEETSDEVYGNAPAVMPVSAWDKSFNGMD